MMLRPHRRAALIVAAGEPVQSEDLQSAAGEMKGRRAAHTARTQDDYVVRVHRIQNSTVA